jgi:hypothetical protein
MSNCGIKVLKRTLFSPLSILLSHLSQSTGSICVGPSVKNAAVYCATSASDLPSAAAISCSSVVMFATAYYVSFTVHESVACVRSALCLRTTHDDARHGVCATAMYRSARSLAETELYGNTAVQQIRRLEYYTHLGSFAAIQSTRVNKDPDARA